MSYARAAADGHGGLIYFRIFVVRKARACERKAQRICKDCRIKKMTDQSRIATTGTFLVIGNAIQMDLVA